MAIYFSANPVGFWDSTIHQAIPRGAVEISPVIYRELMDGQSSGKVISANKAGYPVLTDQPASASPVPTAVSRFQARMALRNAGLFDAAEAAILDSKDTLLMEAWESAVEFRRLSPSITALGAALDLSDAAIDDFFRQAATITA